jgi:hypothetical protein
MLSISHALIQQRQRDLLRRQGFTLEQIAVLMAYHANYQTGRFAYDTPTNQHLTFARWLYQHDKISG